MLFLCLVFAAPPAQADLYRWVDPQSGSVKLSSLPPPWYGDPEKERRAPQVEVIPSRPAAAPPKGQLAVVEKPAAAAGAVAQLEARWRELMQGLSAMPQRQDFDRAGQGLQQQVQAYEAVSAELDRLDPGGAARRRTQQDSLLDRLKKGLEAQFGTKPPAR
jgi:hypothetical protein